ncbi:hypothetical protein B0H14DRAFT_2613667 [Mycena olivaceomarginata]|nr:hypothetical protein B0H14DRAFT_2613667 [Mycena olivaceomarginata]
MDWMELLAVVLMRRDNPQWGAIGNSRVTIQHRDWYFALSEEINADKKDGLHCFYHQAHPPCVTPFNQVARRGGQTHIDDGREEQQEKNLKEKATSDRHLPDTAFPVFGGTGICTSRAQMERAISLNARSAAEDAGLTEQVGIVLYLPEGWGLVPPSSLLPIYRPPLAVSGLLGGHMQDKLGRTRWVFHNGILHYRKQLPSETNTLPTIQNTFSPLELAPAPSSAGYDGSPGLDSQLLPTTRGQRATFRIHISDERDQCSPTDTDDVLHQ